MTTKRNVAKFSEHIEIPLRPFFGSMGVAPPAAAGRVSSAPPGTHAGSLDNKDLLGGLLAATCPAGDGRGKGTHPGSSATKMRPRFPRFASLAPAYFVSSKFAVNGPVSVRLVLAVPKTVPETVKVPLALPS